MCFESGTAILTIPSEPEREALMNCVNITDGSLQTEDGQQTWGEQLTVSASVHKEGTHAS